MQDFPHQYSASARAAVGGDVALDSEGLSQLQSAPPAAFGGPGDRWSPETLLVAAIADCFVLTFRAVARASQLEWTSLTCEVTGTLDRIDRRTQFTRFAIRAALDVPGETDAARARTLLEKAEHGCLITNSLKGDVEFRATVLETSGAHN